MLAAVAATPQKRRTRRDSGPAMKQLLATAGINVQQCVHSRATGNYVLNIFNPGLQQPVEPAQVWTDKMLKSFEGVKVVSVGETRADWKPDQPVIMVDITFTADQIKPKAQPSCEPSSFFALSSSRFYRETHEPARI
jgi:hypothetical protein